MDCAICKRLESERERLQRIHSEKLSVLRANLAAADADQFNGFRISESHARLDLETAHIELRQHKRRHQRAN